MQHPAKIVVSKFSLILSLLIITAYSQNLWAHARWKLDGVIPPRTNSDGLKTAPCGGTMRTSPVIFGVGQTITVEWEETINHEGYYRISLSQANDENFQQIGQNIPDTTNTGFYQQDITLPNTTCDCTLQLIQVMVTASGSSNYYSCSDIHISTDTGAAPAAAMVLTATAYNSAVNLSWDNPSDDFYKAVVLQDTAAISTVPTDGSDYRSGDTVGTADVVYAGPANSVNITSLNNNTLYHYQVFIQNPRKNFSSGTGAEATPQAALDVPADPNPGSTASSSDGGGGHAVILCILCLLGFFRQSLPQEIQT
ncbi:MAG: lytic polysaccharide monooxygenase [Gammaproteobacteria bacterium]|nr:lytic polysaccharide monooxygenase [Gammaproteobacteria bacterium]MDH5802195.1 lytic polysaccharide monooxygenase [Gammaproteobacteria bacterium]